MHMHNIRTFIAGYIPYFFMKGKLMEDIQDVVKTPVQKERFTIRRIIPIIHHNVPPILLEMDLTHKLFYSIY